MVQTRKVTIKSMNSGSETRKSSSKMIEATWTHPLVSNPKRHKRGLQKKLDMPLKKNTNTYLVWNGNRALTSPHPESKVPMWAHGHASLLKSDIYIYISIRPRSMTIPAPSNSCLDNGSRYRVGDSCFFCLAPLICWFVF